MIVVVLNGGSGDSLTIVGSATPDSIVISSLSVNYAAVPFVLVDVEDLTIDAGGSTDTITAAGTGVPGTTQILGGAGDDLVIVNGFTTGELVVNGGAGTNTTGISGLITTNAGSQTYSEAVLLLGATAINAVGTGEATFGGTINGAHAFTVTADDVSFAAAVGGVTPPASFSVTSRQQLDVNVDLTVTGALALTVPEGNPGSDTQDIVISGTATVRSMSSSVDLSAGDDIVLPNRYDDSRFDYPDGALRRQYQ